VHKVKPVLLVLDDQIQYGRSLNRALRNNYDLMLATTLREAKDKLTPNVIGILADVRLDETIPNDRQGLDFVSWARGQRSDLKIISMSALDDEALEAEALNAGANKFLRKPIVISKLKVLLEEMFNSKS